MNRLWVLPILALCLCIAACVAPAPEPTLAMANGDAAALAELQSGYELFRGKCSGCHALPAVADHDERAWEREVDEMVRLKKVRFAPGERQLLLGYLACAAHAAPRGR